MKLLITGGCGFLGSNVAASYLDQGAEVVVVDALLRIGGEDNLRWLEKRATKSRLIHYNVDVADDAALDAVIKKEAPFDYVCHLSGQVAMTTSIANPRRDFETNALGTFNVLEAIRAYSPDSFVAYSSTNKVYGDLLQIEYLEKEKRYTVPSHPDGFDETLPLDFASPYGCSKGAADQYVRDWYRNFGLRTVVFRHSSIYGGRQFSTKDQGWIGWFCQQALTQADAHRLGQPPVPFTIAGTGKQVRDVLHAEDLIRLYHDAYLQREKVVGQVFNVGGGMPNSLSLLELFDRLADLLAIPPLRFEKTPARKSDQKVFIADVRRLNDTLGWSPRVSCAAGLETMLEWLREQSKPNVTQC